MKLWTRCRHEGEEEQPAQGVEEQALGWKSALGVEEQALTWKSGP
jgi:hypothetical protein